jgi:hypothetical protein
MKCVWEWGGGSVSDDMGGGGWDGTHKSYLASLYNKTRINVASFIT